VALDGFKLLLTILGAYIPWIRKIPIDENKKFNHACEVIERVSKKLVEDKFKIVKSDEKDLLSQLININKTLPIEEKLTDNELKDQVINMNI
jgi:cytochrome P450